MTLEVVQPFFVGLKKGLELFDFGLGMKLNVLTTNL